MRQDQLDQREHREDLVVLEHPVHLECQEHPVAHHRNHANRSHPRHAHLVLVAHLGNLEAKDRQDLLDQPERLDMEAEPACQDPLDQRDLQVRLENLEHLEHQDSQENLQLEECRQDHLDPLVLPDQLDHRDPAALLEVATELVRDLVFIWFSILFS